MLSRIIVSIVLLFTFVNAETKELSEKNINNWFTYYYLNPKPELTMDVIKIFSKQGVLTRKNSLATFSSFLSTVFEKNPKLVYSNIDTLEKYSEPERKVFILAIYYSDIDNKFKFIKKLSKTEKEKSMLKRMRTIKFIKTINMDVISPITLDRHWAGFMASGNEVHIFRIIQALEYTNSKIGKEIMTGNAAKWSLISNATQHKKVLEICKNTLEEVPEYLKTILREVILSAEKKLKEKSSK